MRSRPRLFRLLVWLGVSPAGLPAAVAQDPRAVVVPLVRQPTAAEIDAARGEVTVRLGALRWLLAGQAIGVVLSRELDLDRLDAALAGAHAPDAAGTGRDGDPLAACERSLRRVVPGSLQAAVNDLRAAVGRLGRLVRHAHDDAGSAAAALATLAAHVADPELRRTEAGETELRAAFAHASWVVPDETLAPLRHRLSRPNDVGLVSADLIAFLARQRFEQPVRFSRQLAGARITGGGRVALEVSATVPASDGANLLLVHARGSGTIGATADRRRVHVVAVAAPTVTGTQAVRILPSGIVGDTPDVTATCRTRLEAVGIEGLLGRCRLVQRAAGRAIAEALAANDPRVAVTLEDAVRERVREEGLQLAHRVNGLVRSTVWERLRAIDYEPTVVLHNDAAGLWSATTHAHADELAALAPRPALPSGTALDVVRWVHESAVTNALGGLSGATIDEATVRGLWETQFKLSSAEWEALPGGRVPAVIRLAAGRPLALRFVPDGVVIDLRTTGCDRDGRRADAGPRAVRIRYRIAVGAGGLGLVRDPLEFATDVPAAVRTVWEEVLGLFCARDIRPLPRFPNRLARQILTLAHLQAADGWLVVGLRRATPGDGAADRALEAGPTGEERR